jgi:DeoR family glycerol-3-phosphate regulon repressor
LFFNLGTTIEEVASALAGHEDLLVITNNLNVATQLYRLPRIDVIIAGGNVRRNDGGIVGDQAIALIHQFKVDTGVIGVSAIDEDGSLLDFDYREVQIAQAIIENARRVILVADRTKVGRSAPVRIAHIRQVHVFVTDFLASSALCEVCQGNAVRVIETAAEND